MIMLHRRLHRRFDPHNGKLWISKPKLCHRRTGRCIAGDSQSLDPPLQQHFHHLEGQPPDSLLILDPIGGVPGISIIDKIVIGHDPQGFLQDT